MGASTDPRTGAPADPPASPAPLRVLLVEDDEVDRLAFERHLRREAVPFALAVATCLAEARGLLAERAGELDVVITDYHLGDGTAEDVFDLVGDLPVVVITGAGDETTAVKAMRAGAYDYLIKDLDRRYLTVLPVTVENAHRRHLLDRQRLAWEAALRESEERYALAAAGANDGLWDWDLRRGELYLSPRWKATLGYAENELASGSPEEWLGLVHGDDVELLRAQIDAHHRGATPHLENEHRIMTRGGQYRWVSVRGLAVFDDAGRVVRMVGSQRDVTDRKRVEEQLSHAALHDALTGLPNRALFLDRLESAIQRGRRRPDFRFGVIFLDLDRFKVVNDGLGHLAGDQLLQQIAHRLELSVRLGDTVARLGGDEFSVLVEDVDEDRQVEDVAERIDHALQAPFDLSGQEVFSSASLGIALSSHGYERAQDVLRDADTAMYRAKSQGQTRRVVFDPDMHRRAVAQLHLETDLRRALERGELQVYYQPIVALRGGELAGFEALVRWLHPERGLVLPDVFLPVAVETGKMPEIGRFVLVEACRQLREWQRTRPWTERLAVNVNLDGKHVSSDELLEHVDEALAASGLAPRCLGLEITEGMIVQNPTRAATTLGELRARGIRLHLDDFGTGYSSLSQLVRFPLDTLKIDRSFVRGMSVDHDSLELVRTIVALGHNLELEVMAEGVETAEELAQLRALGCEYAQGYHFSRPLPAAELVDDWLDGDGLDGDGLDGGAGAVGSGETAAVAAGAELAAGGGAGAG